MRHVVVGTAGHIDHGKSALVRALTGTDPDRLKEEKARGITIDLGFAHWQAPDLDVAFVDVPGHERFVKNMLAGAGGIDLVMLIVAADESVMPQTREHFEICRLLHVRAGLVVLTKADLVEPELVDLVRLEVQELVQGSFLDGAPMVAASAKTGAGLDDVRAAVIRMAGHVAGRSESGPVRVPVDRVFTVKGFGTVVTGTLVSGHLTGEQELTAEPGDQRVRVRGLQAHGVAVSRAVAGQRVAINLAGAEVSDLVRGQALVTPGHLRPTRVADVRIEVLPSAKAIRHGARVRLHEGTAEVLGRVAISELHATGGGTGDGDAPAPEVPGGRHAFVRLRFEQPVVLTRHDRFIVRAYSPTLTIAGGVVLDPAPPRGGIRTSRGRARFRALDVPDGGGDRLADGVRAGGILMDEAGLSGLPVAQLGWRLALSAEEAATVTRRLMTEGGARLVGERLLATSAIDHVEGDLRRLLATYHETHPLADGMPREEARERLFAHAGEGVFDDVLDRLARAKQVSGRERLALSSHRLALSDEERVARDRLVQRYRDAALAPPSVADVAAAIGSSAAVAEAMVALLIRQKALIRIDTLVFHADALQHLRQTLADLKAGADGTPVRLDVAAFKERFGVTRKYAIPLLEYLDRERVTRRQGDARVLI